MSDWSSDVCSSDLGILAGGLQAASFAVEEHAVIFAADVVALDHSHRQRHQAMRAAVVHRDDLAVRFAIENDLFAAYRARDGRAAELVVERRHIPVVDRKSTRLNSSH